MPSTSEATTAAITTAWLTSPLRSLSATKGTGGQRRSARDLALDLRFRHGTDDRDRARCARQHAVDDPAHVGEGDGAVARQLLVDVDHLVAVQQRPADPAHLPGHALPRQLD